MRTIPADLKFLHCMCRIDYLESALNEGLMLTDHEVKFAPSEDRNELADLVNQVLPLIKGRLQSLGLALEALPQDRVQVLFSGIGNMSGRVPMLCLTEVPPGRNIESHRYVFGSYGIVLKPEWVAKNGADRVIYVGHNSPASQQLFVCLATMKILGLFVDKNGTLLFGNESIRPALNLLSFIEVRDHLLEAEWRIAGNSGFMGGHRATGTRLPLNLCDVEYIFVPNHDEVARITNVVEQVALRKNSATKPIIMEFPECIP